MVLRIADNRRAAAVGAHDLALRHAVHRVVGPFTVHVRLEFRSDGTVELPKDSLQEVHGHSHVQLPPHAGIPEPEQLDDGRVSYQFPSRCTFPREPVSLVGLAVVISISVAGICIWGTLVGSMLPLIFKKINIDPGIASSPFVATFVDVTGIIIFFSVAKAVLGLS